MFVLEFIKKSFSGEKFKILVFRLFSFLGFIIIHRFIRNRLMGPLEVIVLLFY